ncbi:hypothetical protein PHYC_01755 [Phycisphaerales bacterium]|nr:hypothetical protein PHYC_01755 [Phycisphaerales bacterium]
MSRAPSSAPTNLLLGALCVVCGFALPGCLTRKVSVTSEPSGATVFVNDVEVGRTPVEAQFRYYGGYDVRVEKEGFEPLRTRANARAPIYEYPPFDLAANAVPGAEHTVKWHFTLQPSLESSRPKEELEQGLLGRARDLRGQALEPVK